MKEGFKCADGAYPLFIKLAGELGGFCVRVASYELVQGACLVKLHTPTKVVQVLYKDPVVAMEGYRCLEDCFIKGFHLWSIHGAVQLDVKVYG